MNALGNARVLVTGGNGLIGRATVRAFIAAGAHVTVFDRDQPGSKDADTMIRGNILDEHAVRQAVAGQDIVVHLAGIPGLDFAGAVDTYAINSVGAFTVMHAAAESGVSRIIYASSINAAGWPLSPNSVMPPGFPFNEDSTANIGDWYSLSKVANEDAAQMLRSRFGTAITGIRFPLVRDIVADPKKFGAHLSDLMRSDRRRAACEGWSYLDTSDAGRAVVLAASSNTANSPGILVAASRTFLTEDTNFALEMEAPDVPRSAVTGRDVPIDLSRARQLLNFEAHALLDEIAPEHLISLSD